MNWTSIDGSAMLTLERQQEVFVCALVWLAPIEMFFVRQFLKPGALIPPHNWGAAETVTVDQPRLDVSLYPSVKIP